MSAVLHFPEPDERDDPNAAFWADHEVETSQQVNEAVRRLDRPDDDWIDWPFPDLAALTGGMAPGDVWFVNSFSGNGKTTFVTSCIRSWIAAFQKTYVMPLETDAVDFRTYLACQSVGIDPGFVNGGGLRGHPERQTWLKRINAELDRQQLDHGFREHVKIKGVDSINLARLQLATEEAVEWGAKILIVDHIDHIEGGAGRDLYAESVNVTKAAKKLANKHEILFLFTSQMNNEAMKGGRDRLAQFGPPMPHHVYMGAHKRMVATGMIGLHRKLREPHPDETPDDYRAAIKRSRDGELPPMDALEPGVMAVTQMKSRNAGGKEGNKCFLRVENGLVSHLPEKDKHSTTYDGQRRI